MWPFLISGIHKHVFFKFIQKVIIINMIRRMLLGYIMLPVLIIGGYFLYTYLITKSDTWEFAGQIVKVESKTIFGSGVFRNQPGQPSETSAVQHDFNFQIDDSTKIMKEIIRWPTGEEIKAMGGRFDIKDLSRETTHGSLKDMEDIVSTAETTVYINAEFDNPIDKPKGLVASGILYRVFSQPVVKTTTP